MAIMGCQTGLENSRKSVKSQGLSGNPDLGKQSSN